MAGAESAVRHVVVERPVIPVRLVKGNKFLRWPKADGDDSTFVPVTLRVDPQGHIVYWQEPSRDAECIEISSIRDTRHGRYAKEPKPDKYERAVQMYLDAQQLKLLQNTNVELSQKCFTIVCGSKLVDLTFYNFVSVESNPQDIVTEWSDVLLKIAYHPTTRHISLQTGYEKAFCKLKHDTDQMGHIPLSKVIKTLGAKSKLVENALSNIGVISSKVSKEPVIRPQDFHFAQFRKLIQLCCPRPEVDGVFSQLGTGAKRMYINHDKLRDFVNTRQRDPTINSLLYPLLTNDQSLDLVQKYEPNVMFANKGKLTLEGFEAYLQSDDNLIVSMEIYMKSEEPLSKPLSHYFVNSSHNTYLTGTQLKSKSSAEMYRQVLLTGCRCVELDCWDREDEPAITHGFTFCTDVTFREVIEAINESAFKTSSYPVVLSFENHVDVPEQQALMAKYCREIFGEKLLIEPLASHPLEMGVSLPSPEHLLNKIIIKNKKQRQVPQTAKERRKQAPVDDVTSNDRRKSSPPADVASAIIDQQKGSVSREPAEVTPSPPNQAAGGDVMTSAVTDADGKKEADDDVTTTPRDVTTADVDSDDDEDEGQLTTTEYEVHAKDSGTASKESKASAAMSQLVNYIQPVRFKSFELSLRRKRSYEISSFTETTALKLLTDDPVAFVKYNQRQMSRIYPKGARVESSNYMPQGFWNAGCQFVALNFQMLDLPMQMNLAKFELNGGCGYLQKPSLMRYKDKQFDPFSERIDGIVAKQLNIKILSGQFLSSSKLSTYVEVDMFGLPSDTQRKRIRTKTIENNALNPQYNSPLYQFKKIILPELALLRIAVMDGGGNLVGQRFFPVEYIKPGYRYITLRNEANQSLMMQSLFIYVEVLDYIDEEVKDMIDALVNPIQAVADKERKEMEMLSRMSAWRKFLDEDEIRSMIDEQDSPAAHAITNDVTKSRVKSSYKKEKVIPASNGMKSQVQAPVQAPKAPQNVVKEPQRMEIFEPQNLVDLKLGKSYLKLMKENEKNLKNYKEKQKENFSKFYYQLYPNDKPKKSMTKLFRKKSTDCVLSKEEKQKRIENFVRDDLQVERDWRLQQVNHIINKFTQLVTNHQKFELNQLTSMCDREKAEVQRLKDLEKEDLIQKIPVNIDRRDSEKRRKEITTNHINSCVQQIVQLGDKQKERQNEVEKKQSEIRLSLADEADTMSKSVHLLIDSQIKDLKDVIETRMSMLKIQRSSSSSSESTSTIL